MNYFTRPESLPTASAQSPIQARPFPADSGVFPDRLGPARPVVGHLLVAKGVFPGEPGAVPNDFGRLANGLGAVPNDSEHFPNDLGSVQNDLGSGFPGHFGVINHRNRLESSSLAEKPQKPVFLAKNRDVVKKSQSGRPKTGCQRPLQE